MTKIQFNTQPKKYWYKPEFINPKHKPESLTFDDVWSMAVKVDIYTIKTLPNNNPSILAHYGRMDCFNHSHIIETLIVP